jgi:hypothetical protein
MDQDEIIFPVDDDDVFHPGLSDLARSLSAHTDLVFWCHAAAGYGPSGTSPTVHRWSERALFSNNCGLRKSFLRKWFSTQECRDLLASHRAAQETVSRHFGIEGADLNPLGPVVDLVHHRAAFYPEHFGLQLLHVGSLAGFWVRSITDDPTRAFEGADLTARFDLPDGLKWAAPFLARYWDFMATVEAGRRRG